MSDDELITQSKLMQFVNKHSFFLFIMMAILIASIIVSISMELYNISGAAQLDLSRPGYNSVRSQVTSGESDMKTFSGNGVINQDVINSFKALYDTQSKKVKQIDAFGGDPLSPDALGFNSIE